MNPIEYAVSLLAPHTCIRCGKESAPLCQGCANQLSSSQFIPQDGNLCSLWAFTEYHGAAKELVNLLKFSRAKAVANTIATLMAASVPLLPCPTVVSCVPTAQKRVRARGYDQAELIAKALAERLRLPYVSTLERVTSTRQVGSTRAQRMAQMEHAFRIRNPTQYKDKNILLVDDVATTGSTLMAGARVLRQTGANNVRGISFVYQPK